MPLDSLYRVTAGGMQTSKSVHLEAANGEHVVLDVDPTSESTHAGGEALMILGGVGLLTGGILLYADAVTAGLCSDPEGNCSASKGVLWAGIGSAAAGAVAMLVGLKMIQPTSIEQSAGTREATEGGSVAVRGAWTRMPVWREPPPEAASLPRATGIPILSATF